MKRVASMWHEYKKCIPVQGLLTGFFGLPPAKGDDTVWAAKFFVDAKEAYWFSLTFLLADLYIIDAYSWVKRSSRISTVGFKVGFSEYILRAFG